MKKIIAVFTTIVIIASVLLVMVYSDRLFTSGSVFKRNENDGDTVPQEIDIAVALKDTVKAKYSYSMIDVRGEVIDFYTDDDGNEYVKDENGNLVMGKMPEEKNERKDLISSESEVWSYAQQVLPIITDSPERFSEYKINAVGEGKDKNYTLDFYEYLFGYKTENSITINMDAYGNVKSFYCKDDIDYDAVDEEALSAVTDTVLEEFAIEMLDKEIDGIYTSPSIENEFLICRDHKYAIQISVSYIGENGDQGFAEVYEYWLD